jgi:hypothetical protein
MLARLKDHLLIRSQLFHRIGVNYLELGEFLLEELILFAE